MKDETKLKQNYLQIAQLIFKTLVSVAKWSSVTGTLETLFTIQMVYQVKILLLFMILLSSDVMLHKYPVIF